jgi:hypothetical protein
LQAFANPKVETVEELQGRRKTLHLGMCKLVLEDLSFLAEQKNSLRNSCVWDHPKQCQQLKFNIQTEFQKLVLEHASLSSNVFNNDEVYKLKVAEIIDAKKNGVLKLDTYLESTYLGFDLAALDRICDAPLQYFADPCLVLPLLTGLTHFPWAAVVKDRSPEIDLGVWDAAAVAARPLESVAEALAGNANIRVVTLKDVKLVLSEGWATTRIEWVGNAAVQALPATVGLVLRNCVSLTSLDLRCDEGAGGGVRRRTKHSQATGSIPHYWLHPPWVQDSLDPTGSLSKGAHSPRARMHALAIGPSPREATKRARGGAGT